MLLLLEGEGQDVLAYSALAVVLRDFLVFVERNHLVQELLGNLMQRRQLERCDADFDIRQLSYDGLHLGVFDPVQRFNHLQVVFLLLVFENSCLDWCEVLLVTQVDMVQQWTLSWQECTSQLKRFRMPELGFFLFLRRVESLVFFHLNYEPDFCRVAEVGDCKAADFLDERLTSELQLILTLLD